MQFLIEAAIVWIIVAINLCGIKAVGRTQLITTILKVVPLLIIGFAGLPYIHLSYLSDNFVSPTMSGTQALLGAMTVTLWAFTGFESATIPADDATHVRHIKQATIWGTLFVGLLYILCSFTLLGLIPGDQLKQSISPFADATTLLFGATAAKLIAVCACISIIGSLNGCLLVQALDSVAAARFNLGPKSFTYLKKNNVAHLAFVWSGIAITLLLALSLHKTLIEQFNFIILISTLAFLIPYFICCMAAFILHLKKDTGLSYKNRPKAFLITVFASIYSFCTMIGAGKDIVFYGSLFFFSAFPLYVVLFWKKKELQEAE